MPLPQIAQEAVRLIQQHTASIGISADFVTLGAAAANIAVQAFKSGKRLVTYLIRRKQKGEAPETPAKKTSKKHVAILVDINRRMLHDVAAYLERQDIEADLVLVTNDEDYGPKPKFLDPQNPDEWADMVREFSEAMNKVKHEIGSAHAHFFISAPMPVAFGIGSVWGTVDTATVYHWQDNKYYPVMQISRNLR